MEPANRGAAWHHVLAACLFYTMARFGQLNLLQMTQTQAIGNVCAPPSNHTPKTEQNARNIAPIYV
jgi:hypothetical protein